MITIFQAKIVFVSFETKKNVQKIVVSNFWRYIKSIDILSQKLFQEKIFEIDIRTTLS